MKNNECKYFMKIGEKNIHTIKKRTIENALESHKMREKDTPL